MLLSYVRPHKPVTSQKLAHWVRDVLAEAGVERSFKAHSVRGAYAMAKGVSLSERFNTADWSRELTFRRFYYRETKNTKCVSKVLQAENTRSQLKFQGLCAQLDCVGGYRGHVVFPKAACSY